MAGTVYKRKDGRWVARLTVEGKRRYRYASTETEAHKRLAEMQAEVSYTGSIPNPGNKTLNDLLDLWLDSSDLRPASRASYGRVLKNHIRPALGKKRLKSLRAEDLQRFYNELKRKGYKRIPALAHSILHRALKLGVLWGYLSDNPADKVVAPRKSSDRKQLWSAEELAHFLDGVADNWLYPLFFTAITTGLRLGELNGLKWSDIDLEHAVLEVRRTLQWINSQWIEGPTKSRSGERRVALAPKTIEALCYQQAQQSAWKAQAAEKWRGGEWVFTNFTGGPLSRSTTQHALNRLCDELELPRMSMHGFRHLHATILLAGNLPVPAVSTRLGHSNPAITMSVYAHALKGQDEEATREVEWVFEGL